MLTIISTSLTTALVAATLASAAHDNSAFARRKHHARAGLNNTVETRGQYTLVDKWQGDNFFDGFSFFTAADPTNGMVNYQSKANALSKGLAYVKNGVATIKVDAWTNLASGAHRDSVRIVTLKDYTQGLFILDVKNMPYGCATWPSYWSTGPNWPAGGEIDVVEGVNDGGVNMYSLHTSGGCSSDDSGNAPIGYSAKAVGSKIFGTECAIGDSIGCSFNDNEKSSYGSALNAAGGAVFATQWSSAGIRIFRFPTGKVPADITNGVPNPAGWDTQYLKAAWASTTCNINQFFQKHQFVLDITLAGNWAGNQQIYKAAGCPGTPQSQVATGSNFANAAWDINSFSIYQ